MFKIKSEEKHVVIFFYVCFLFYLFYLWILYAFNQWNGDRYAYEQYYVFKSISEWGVEVGYGYLNILFNNAGFDYQVFNIFIASLTMIFVSKYLLEFSALPFLTLIIYSVVFFPLDYVLMRNFLAFSIFLQGLFFLYKGGGRNRLVYILFVFIATTIHQSSIALLIFSIIPVNRVISLKLSICVFLIVLFAYVLMKSSWIEFEYYKNHMAYYQVSIKNAILISILSISSTFVVIFTHFLIKNKYTCSSCRRGGVSTYYHAIVNINIVSLLFIFLYFEADIFVRFYRIIAFLNIVYFLSIIFVDSKNAILYFLYLLFSCVHLFFYFIAPFFELTVIPLFFSNLIL